MDDKRETTTATAMAEIQREASLRYALDNLRRELTKYVRAYPYDGADEMPEHAISWVTLPDAGPDKAILHAMVETPDIWLRTLPEGVVLVPKDALRKYAPHAAEGLIWAGRELILLAAWHAKEKREAAQGKAIL